MTRNFSGFVSGTLIHSINGLIPIEKIQIGDLVLSNSQNNEDTPTYKRVISTFECHDKDVLYLSYGLIEKRKETDTCGSCFVVVTGNQLFWVERSESWEVSDTIYQKQWVSADRLRSGMMLSLADGRLAEVFMVQKIVRTITPNIGWLQVDDLPLGSIVDLTGDLPKGYPRNGMGWVTDELFANDGIEWEDYEDHVWLHQSVYNFEVEFNSVYFIGNLGVMVK